MDALRRDLRYALRSLARSKGFVAVAVLSLALALGLNTTIYAVLDGFINPYLPYRTPERLVRFGITASYLGDRVFSPNDRYLFLRERVRFADTVAIYTLGQSLAESGGVRENVAVAGVSRNFFALVDARPVWGRVFQPDGDDDAIVVSAALWRRLLHGQPFESSPSLAIDGRSYTVIGMMPPEMSLPNADLWRALSPEAMAQGIPGRSPQIIARLNDGIEPQRARAELNLLVKELGQVRFRKPGLYFDGSLKTLDEDPYRLGPSHWALAASGLIILLIACANLANLMLARGLARRGELALHLAIGASRRTLVRQLTAEALVLALAGGALGIVLTTWGIGLAAGNLPTAQSFITLRPIHLTWRIFAYALLASGLTTVLTGLLPAIRISDVHVTEPLKDNAGTTTGRSRNRYSPLAIAQVALALTLLMSSAVLLRSARQIGVEGADLNQMNLFSIQVQPPETGEPSRPTLEHLRQRVRKIPGVEGAATTHYVGYCCQTRMSAPVVADWEGAASNPLMVVGFSEVSADYLRVLQRRIAAGRHFDRNDVDGAILNQTAARALWPQQDPVGHSLRIDSGPWVRVVGVVEDFRYDAAAWGRLPPAIYRLRISSDAESGMIYFRSNGTNPNVQADVVRDIQVTAGLNAPPSIYDWGFTTRINASVKTYIAGLFIFLGACGLGLASLGLYGVLAHAVSRRTREFGVRIALGATTRDISRLVISDGTVMFLAGTALGAFVAMFMAQFVRTLLYNVAYTDVRSLILSEIIVCGVSFLACLVPARRAMQADPMEILRAT